MPAATAAAEPEDEPPGRAFRIVRIARRTRAEKVNSVVTVLPMITAPASRSRVTAVQSRIGLRPLSNGEPHSVRIIGDVEDVLDRDRDAVQRA